MMMKPASLVTLAALALAGCTTTGDPYYSSRDPYAPRDPYGPRTMIGAGAGAVAGGLIGSSIAGNRVAGAIAGAAIGGLIGGAIGAQLDEEDRILAYEAEMEALERGRSGVPYRWRNPDNGRYGNVVPGRSYNSPNGMCRDYTHTIYIDGRPQTARGTACRNPDSTWTPVS